MGQTVGKLLHKLFSTQRQLKILMLGLDAAGKTAILQRLKLGQTVGTVRTIGFNVESLVYKNLSFVVWDVGGQYKIRFLWQHYFQGTQGLIFVVDSSDRERMVEVKSEFHKIASDPRLASTKVLVFANKKDLKNTMEIEEIIDRMGLPLIPQKDWHVQSSCAITGDGLADGLDWLAHAFDLQTNH